MSFMKETPYEKVGRNIGYITMVYLGIVALNILATFMTRTPNLIINLATLLFILVTPIVAWISSTWGKKGKKAGSTAVAISIVLTITGLAVFIYGILQLWTALNVRPLITHFEIALTVPLITIISSYIIAELYERKIPEIYWRVSRAISDRVRGAVSSSGIAIVGPTIAFFGLLNFDAYFAFLTLAYSLIELKRTISEILTTRKQRKLETQLKENLTKVLTSIPAVVSVDDIILDPANNFIHIRVKFSVSHVLSDKEIEAAIDYAMTYIIENFGIVSHVYVEVEKKVPDTIKVSIPVKDDNVISEQFRAPKYAIVEIKTVSGEISNREIIDKPISDDKMAEVQAMRSLVSKGVSVIGTKNIDPKAENEAKGWLIKIVRVRSNTLDEAIDEIKNMIISR